MMLIWWNWGNVISHQLPTLMSWDFEVMSDKFNMGKVCPEQVIPENNNNNNSNKHNNTNKNLYHIYNCRDYKFDMARVQSCDHLCRSSAYWTWTEFCWIINSEQLNKMLTIKYLWAGCLQFGKVEFMYPTQKSLV